MKKEVATVSNGTVTISKFGKATTQVEITGTLQNGNSASCIITLKPKYLADVAKNGEYVKYKANGYEQWRVMSKKGSGADGITTIISAGSPENVEIKYPNKASDYISKLKEACNKYLNTNFATSVRNVGTDSKGNNNSAYNTELEDLKNKSLKNIGKDYWVGYCKEIERLACEEAADRDCYYVNNKGSNSYITYKGDKNVKNSKGIRPIVTLKNKIIVIGGDGTKENPYEISME